MNIVIPDFIDIPKSHRQALTQRGAVMYDDVPDANTLMERIKDAEIITANYVDITSEIIDRAPRLKAIISPAVGFDWIDHAYAADKGIKVVNCPTFLSITVAEHAIALLFAVSRHVVAAADDLRQGNWNPKQFVGLELAGKHLGLVGYGRIGKHIENLATGIGLTVPHVNSKSGGNELDALMQSSDAVCLCLPLNDATRNLIDARRIALMKPDAILINIARGAIVDQTALKEALQNSRLTGAGLDVFADEPLSGRPNEAIIELARLPNVVATPHMAYNTIQSQDKFGAELTHNIDALLTGTPVNVVNGV